MPSFAERQLLRRVKRFIPPGATVLAVDVAETHDSDGRRRATPIVLTDVSLVVMPMRGATGVVTTIPFRDVFSALAPNDFPILEVRWLQDGSNTERSVALEFARHGENDGFRGEFFDALEAWKAANAEG